MNDKKEILKIVLYTLVFGKLMPEDTKIKEVRKVAMKITKGMTNNFTKNITSKGGEINE